MSVAVFFTLAGLLAAVMIALALIWPQGLGMRSPAPFGHTVVSEQLDTPTPATAPPRAVVAAPPLTTTERAAPANAVSSPPPVPPAQATGANLKGAL